MQAWKDEFAEIAETIYFSEDEYLRERTKDITGVQGYIEKGLPFLTDKQMDQADQYVVRGIIGNLYRIIGDTDQAIEVLATNVQYAQQVDDAQKEAVSRIRLGEAQKYAGAYGEAMKEFEQANSMIEVHSMKHLEDFVHQHMGKLCLELGEYAKALDLFQKAYAIRLEKGDTELLSSTKDACTYARKKIHSI